MIPIHPVVDCLASRCGSFQLGQDRQLARALSLRSDFALRCLDGFRPTIRRSPNAAPKVDLPRVERGSECCLSALAPVDTTSRPIVATTRRSTQRRPRAPARRPRAPGAPAAIRAGMFANRSRSRPSRPPVTATAPLYRPPTAWRTRQPCRATAARSRMPPGSPSTSTASRYAPSAPSMAPYRRGR